MPSYVLVGASRGIGFALMKALSEDSNNTVINVVRSVDAAKAKAVAELPDRTQAIHFVHGDLDDYKTLEKAAADVATITGGAIDVLIVNGGVTAGGEKLLSEEITSDPAAFERNMLTTFRTNTLGPAEAVAYFAPLVLRGTLKKIVVVSTGLADIPLTSHTDFSGASPYAISKIAVNMAVTKFHLEFRERGVTVFAISPGLVATEFGTDPKNPPSAEEQAARMAAMGTIIENFKKFDPEWNGLPLTPDQSAAAVLDVVAKATIEKEGGIMVSHHGSTEKWL